MTEITKSFHTHAEGEAFGWWGQATHPAHLDKDGKLDAKTAWSVSIEYALSSWQAVERLELAIGDKLKEVKE